MCVRERKGERERKIESMCVRESIRERDRKSEREKRKKVDV